MSTEPLTPEERALAERLARLGPHGEPSPALDARVLAAARAELEAAAPPARRRRRWPYVVGIAASCALAVGVAWRLRPLPEPPAMARKEAAATVAEMAPVEAAPPAAAMQAKPVAPPQPVPPPAQAPAPAVDAAAATAREADAAAPAAAAKAASEVAPENAEAAPAFVAEPPATLAAPAPAPPPPAAATRTDRNGASTGQPVRQEAGAAAQARESRLAAPLPEEDVEDIPPATADNPEVRDAWLQRIRELMAAGELDLARESLARFRERHPQHPIPDDLRPLLQQ
ncbi:hypothetical protein [Vulcaniibacterium gelatinicum]|uniref:hypothetical protein n=1 Tax=Vulcaniibacterium gelatinicum TaxID=2598725 RepID=UPI0011CAC21E|nr:hypothetical protein [Vulcaniibacterium gelatinicum]